jgi:hypothetical protein
VDEETQMPLSIQALWQPWNRLGMALSLTRNSALNIIDLLA